jgi:uncharacterized protein YjbI with pentapeptide repeats
MQIYLMLSSNTLSHRIPRLIGTGSPSNIQPFEDGAYFGKDNFVTGAVVFQAAEFRGPLVATRNQFSAGTTLSFHYAHFDNFAFFNFSNFETRTFFTGAHFTAEAAFDGVNFNQVSFEHSIFGSGAHFETTLFNGPVTFDGATIHAVYFSSIGTVGNPPRMIDDPPRSTATAQFQSDVDFRGFTYDRMQVATAAVLRKSDGSSRIQPYDREVFLRLEAAFRKQGQDDVADSIYLEGRRVERKLKWQSGHASNYAPDFLLFVLTNYGVRPYTRLLPMAIISLALGACFFSRSGAVSWETADRLTKWQKFVQACLVSFRSFVPLDLPLASHWQLGKEPVKFIFVTIRPTTAATILRLLGAIVVPLTILALSGYLRYVPR